MYAVAFDLDTEILKASYPSDSYNNAYADIRTFLLKNNFDWQQGSLYFGDKEKMNAVKCVLTIQNMSKEFPWFKASVKDIRMLRIEELNDLKDAL